jgi:hypothetical protein
MKPFSARHAWQDGGVSPHPSEQGARIMRTTAFPSRVVFPSLAALVLLAASPASAQEVGAGVEVQGDEHRAGAGVGAGPGGVGAGAHVGGDEHSAGAHVGAGPGGANAGAEIGGDEHKARVGVGAGPNGAGVHIGVEDRDPSD